MAGAPSSNRELGNKLFREGHYLKAAATYSKAIKEDDPQDAVLYSKFSKALDDAHTVIRLRPDWDKGYFRKASVLEAMGRPEEALQVYHEALRLSPNNREVGDRVRNLNKLLKKKSASAPPAGVEVAASG